MLHKYCLQNRNIFYSINSRLQLPFFFLFFLHLSRINRFNINKKSFFKKKFAISYSNIKLLLNFFMKKKIKYSHVKHYLQKIGPLKHYLKNRTNFLLIFKLFYLFINYHKLYCQNKNYIYKIKAQNFFFLLKKKPHRTRKARVMRLVLISIVLCLCLIYF